MRSRSTRFRSRFATTWSARWTRISTSSSPSSRGSRSATEIGSEQMPVAGHEGHAAVGAQAEARDDGAVSEGLGVGCVVEDHGFLVLEHVPAEGVLAGAVSRMSTPTRDSGRISSAIITVIAAIGMSSLSAASFARKSIGRVGTSLQRPAGLECLEPFPLLDFGSRCHLTQPGIPPGPPSVLPNVASDKRSRATWPSLGRVRKPRIAWARERSQRSHRGRHGRPAGRLRVAVRAAGIGAAGAGTRLGRGPRSRGRWRASAARSSSPRTRAG